MRKFSPKERDAILAGLRLLQEFLDPGEEACEEAGIMDIATNNDVHNPITIKEIDRLCDVLNHKGSQ